MITCKHCGTTFATAARSSSTRCSGCGAAVYVPAPVRRANGGDADAPVSRTRTATEPPSITDGDAVVIIVMAVVAAAWAATKIWQRWRLWRSDPPPDHRA